MITDRDKTDVTDTALMANYGHPRLEFSYGRGSHLYTADGQAWLDFSSGIAVTSLGHCHPELVHALHEQADRLWHCSNLFRIGPTETLARRLTELTFADRVFFSNSGTEAIEAGFKIMRRFHHDHGDTGRKRIITLSNSFHGRTLAPVAACRNPVHTEGFLAGDHGFDQVPWGDLEALRAAIGPETAGVVLEPVQGEGGIRVADPDYLAGVRRLCDDHGILLFFDEVQCGAGRSGSFFAHEQLGTTPDLLASAKGLGGGFPIGACLATERVAAPMVAGSHGSTFGGNPLATAVAGKAVEIIADPQFLDTVRSRATHLHRTLDEVIARYPTVLSGRSGLGLMTGLQCAEDNGRVLEALHDRRMLAVKAGGNSLRLLPALTVSESEINQAVGILDEACDSLAQSPAEAPV